MKTQLEPSLTDSSPEKEFKKTTDSTDDENTDFENQKDDGTDDSDDTGKAGSDERPVHSYYTIPKPPPEVWERYSSHGEGSPAESEIVENYIPLVKSIVGRMAMSLPTHVAVEDLYSAGMVGLLSAVRRYDMAGGSSFEAYARVRIRGAIFDELRRAHWLPRSVHDKARKVENVMRQLEQEKGEAPSDEEVADALDMSMSQYNKLLTYIRPAVFICLDSVKNGDDANGDSQHATVADASQPDPYEESSKYELIEIIKDHIKKLPEMQQKVLALYYFKDLRLREIAEAFGVTESRICQIHTKAILSIRGFIKKHESKGTLEVE